MKVGVKATEAASVWIRPLGASLGVASDVPSLCALYTSLATNFRLPPFGRKLAAWSLVICALRLLARGLT